MPTKKIVLITGASAGIGSACAHTFAGEGYDVILLARRAERLDALADELKNNYDVAVHKLVGDIRDRENMEYLLETLPSPWKKIDVLINNAGLSQGLDPFDKASLTDWEVMIDTNIKGLLFVSRVVSAWMAERRQGHIVNIGSIAGKEVYPNGNVYCATKHAVDALNKAMRIDLLPHGIRVTEINPGMVETEFSLVRFKGDAQRAKKVYDGFEPLHARDVADAIWFAVSRPPHVNINEMLIMPSAQANSTTLIRD